MNLPEETIAQLEHSLPTPHLHERLSRQALPPTPKVTGKAVAKVALELAHQLPLAQAIAMGVHQLAPAGSMGREQIERITGIAMKLIAEGLRMDDAVTIALHEPAHIRVNAPLSKTLESKLFPAALTGEKVLAEAKVLNAAGTRMDSALAEAVKKLAAPRPVSAAQASGIVDAAHKLYVDGMRIVEALNVALRRSMPKTAP